MIFLLGILLKRAGYAFGVFFLDLTIVLIAYWSARYFIRHKKRSGFYPFMLIMIIYLTAIGLLQYKFRPDAADGLIITGSVIIGILLLLVHSTRSAIVVTLLPMSVILIAAFTDARTFHNTFHSVPFESYIRGKYTFTQRVIADSIIDHYKKPDKVKAELLILQAGKENENDMIEEAARDYNLGIDADPDNANGYNQRGYFKLSRNSLDMPNVYLALKDFERALTLKPDFAEALFHRGLCYSIMNGKDRACSDFRRAKELNPKLDVEEELEKNCSGKE